MLPTIIVRYGELALKSEPVRRRFEESLLNSIRHKLGDLRYNIRTERGRIFVDTASRTTVIKRLSRVPGITSLSPAVRTKANLDDIRTEAVRIAKKMLKPGMSFAVRTNRVGKHTFSSRDVNAKLGSSILSIMKNLKVDLISPDIEISIDIRGDDAYIFSNTVKGIGGLPVGTQGRVMAILSGSRNDVVAAYLVLKRGCAVSSLFLNPQDTLNNPAARRVILSAKKLAQFGSASVLWSFPFKRILTELRKKQVKKASIFIRERCKLRAAEMVAKRAGAEAIVIGDDAKVVEKMKLTNLGAIDADCKLAVLRPLSCMEENEIKEISEKIGLKTSAGFSPACSIPVGKIVSEELQTLEKLININKIIEDASKKIKKIKVG